MTLLAADVYRDYEVAGVPASGANQPDKAEIRSLLTTYESLFGTVGLGYQTRSLLFSDLAHGANSLALVYGDTTPAFNGLYQKSGVSGAGSWSRVADSPKGVIRLTVTGGTGNAIIATATETPTIPGDKLYLMTPTAANTAATTVNIDSAGAVTIKNALGSSLAANSLLVDIPVLMAWQTDHYQILVSVPVDATGVLTDAIAARDAASGYATAAASSASALGNQVHQYDTRALAIAATIPVGVLAIKVTRHATGYPLSYATYIPGTNTGPMNFAEAGGHYWELDLTCPEIQALWFGVKADNSHDDTTMIQAAITACIARNNAKLVLPVGLIKVTATINISTASANFSMIGQGRFATCFVQATDYGDVFNMFSVPTARFADFGINSLAKRTTGAYFDLDSCYEATFQHLWLSEPFIAFKMQNNAGVLIDNVNIIGAQYFDGPYQSGSRHIWLTSGGAGNTAVRISNTSCNGSAAPATFSRFEYAMKVDLVDGLWVTNSSFAAANQAMIGIFGGAGIKFSNVWTDFYALNGMVFGGSTAIVDFTAASCTSEGSAGYGINFNNVNLVGAMFGFSQIGFNALNGLLVQSGNKISFGFNFFYANSGTPVAIITGTNIDISHNQMGTATANNVTIGVGASRGQVKDNIFTGATTDVVNSGGFSVSGNIAS